MDRPLNQLDTVDDMKNEKWEDSPVKCWEQNFSIYKDKFKKEIPKNNVKEYQCSKSDKTVENDLSSCKAVLKINSSTGPLSVEVEIKLNTIKMLNHQYVDIIKKNNVAYPRSEILSKNDDDVRVAQYILKLAKQKYPNANPVENDYHESLDQILSMKEDHEETYLKKLEKNETEIFFNENELKQNKIYTTKAIKKLKNSDRISSTSNLDENQAFTKKRLMDCLLKKINKKDVTQDQIEESNEVCNRPFYNNCLENENMHDKNIEKGFNRKELISKKRKIMLHETLYSNSQIINNDLTNPTDSSILFNSSYPSPIRSPKSRHSPISFIPFTKDTSANIINQVINNTYSLYQHQINKSSPMSIMTNTPNIMISQGFNSLTHTTNEESVMKNKIGGVSSIQSLNSYNSEHSSIDHDLLYVPSPESESDFNSRLYIATVNDDIETTPGIRKEIDLEEYSDIEDYYSELKRAKICRDKAYIKKLFGKRKNESYQKRRKSKNLNEKEYAVSYNMWQNAPLDLSIKHQYNILPDSENRHILHFAHENIGRQNLTSVFGNSDYIYRDSSLYNILTNKSDLNKTYESNLVSNRNFDFIEPRKSYVSNNGSYREYQKKNEINQFTSTKCLERQYPYVCAVCNMEFSTVDLLSKHHKSKNHLRGLVDIGLLSENLNTKIKESRIPIEKIIDPNTGNIIPDLLKMYLSNWNTK